MKKKRKKKNKGPCLIRYDAAAPGKGAAAFVFGPIWLAGKPASERRKCCCAGSARSSGLGHLLRGRAPRWVLPRDFPGASFQLDAQHRWRPNQDTQPTLLSCPEKLARVPADAGGSRPGSRHTRSQRMGRWVGGPANPRPRSSLQFDLNGWHSTSEVDPLSWVVRPQLAGNLGLSRSRHSKVTPKSVDTAT